MDAAVPDDTAYDQLQLLCLRESGAATELLKGTRALNLRHRLDTASRQRCRGADQRPL